MSLFSFRPTKEGVQGAPTIFCFILYTYDVLNPQKCCNLPPRLQRPSIFPIHLDFAGATPVHLDFNGTTPIHLDFNGGTPPSLPFTSISTAPPPSTSISKGEPLHHFRPPQFRQGNPSFTSVHLDFDGRPLRHFRSPRFQRHHPHSPRFRWGNPSITSVHLDIDGGTPPSLPFTSISMGEPLLSVPPPSLDSVY